ncbi:MAG: hypothetical protein FWE95_00270 [Planctomycetaceae bacterium]|nr:hypothetical protein [Planctomycetaceae bacterium]
MESTFSEPHLLTKQTFRPMPFIMVASVWAIALVVIVSDIFGEFFPILISLILAVAFTLCFVLYRGSQYRIFTDRIEHSHGNSFCWVPWQKMSFGKWQTFAFSELDSIEWDVRGSSDDGPSDTTFIRFHFAFRTLIPRQELDLSCQFTEACRTVERDVIAPKISRALEEGEVVTFKCPGRLGSHEIQIDHEKIQVWNQDRLAYDETILWDKIATIRFSKGKETGSGNFLAQSRIYLEDPSGETIEFDMPSHNPHALWAVIVERCTLPTLQVLEFPKKEKFDFWKSSSTSRCSMAKS